MSLGKRIKDRREELDISVDALATAVSKTPSAIYQWQSGDTEPTGPNLVRAAKALKTTERWLAFEEGPKDREEALGMTDEEESLLDFFRVLPEEVRHAQLTTMKHLAAQYRANRGQKS